MKKIAIIPLIFLASCTSIEPFSYTNRSAEIDYEIEQRQFACAENGTCGSYALPYYLK